MTQSVVERMRMRKFIIEDGVFGKRLILTSNWSDNYLYSIPVDEIKEIDLNHENGWCDKDISFLKHFSFLESLEILTVDIEDFSPIYRFKTLKNLSLPYLVKTEFDFTELPELESCFLDWWPGARSIFQVKTLKKLYIYSYMPTNTDDFAQLTHLENLEFGNGPLTNLEGLSALKKLDSLALFCFRRLEDLHGIEALTNLEFLRIDFCKKIQKIDAVRDLLNLKQLHILNCGDIESIKPIEKLVNLRDLMISEGTRIRDYDVTPILKLSRLQRLDLTDNKKYQHQLKDFKAYYGSPEALKLYKEECGISHEDPPHWENLI